jgi:SCP-2 sterol transfer family
VPRAQDLIATAYQRFIGEVPALDKLKLVIRLELRARGDVQVFRVRVPGPEVTKGEPEDARVMITMPRSHFNELATDGRLKHWREAYQHGDVKIGGDPEVTKLIGTVIQRHEARTRLKRVH